MYEVIHSSLSYLPSPYYRTIQFIISFESWSLVHCLSVENNFFFDSIESLNILLPLLVVCVVKKSAPEGALDNRLN
jgi:hypothetical protein